MRDYTKEYADLAQTYKQATARAASADEKARLKALYDQAVSDVALEQQMEADERKRTAPAAQPRKLTGMEEAKGLGRALAQGATFGFGEEIESLPYAIPGGETVAQARQRIRGEMKQYREARPGVALGAEVAGAVIPAVLTGGAAAPAAGAGLATRAASAVGRSAALQGALSGAGAAEGGPLARLAGGTVGAVTGGTIGKVGGAVAAKGGRAIERMRQGGPPRPDAGIAAATRMAERAGITDLPTAIQQAAETAPAETRLMDVLGTPGRRLASGIRLAGGRPGQVVEETMEQRLAEAPGRLLRGLETTGRSAENLTATVDDLIAQRKLAANPLYEQLREQPPVMNRQLEEMIATRPSLQRAQRDAVKLAAEEGVQLPTMDTPAGPMPLRTPEMLHYMKLALDDMIDIGKKPGEGGLGKTTLSKIRDTKNEFLNIVDNAVPVFKAARDAWAGPSALKTAVEDGVQAAKSKVNVDALAKQVQELSPSEQEFYRRGYLQTIRERIDDMGLKPQEIRSAGFEKRMQAVFGDEADAIVQALRQEVDLTTTGQALVRGSQTAERAQDLADIEGGLFSGRLIRATGEKVRTAARAAEAVESRLRTGISEQRRGQVARTLMTRAQEAEPIISALNREAAAFRRGEQARRVVGMPLSRLIAGRTVGAFNSQQ